MEIYSDSLIEEDWFKNLNETFKHSDCKKILSRGKNIPTVENLIKYDRPDIILIKDKKPVLVLEKMKEVPTGHNPLQRAARLVRAVENNIPAIYFLPFRAKKHGKYAAVCNLNLRLLEAFEKMWKIHNSPILAVNWICDQDGELVDDGSEDNNLKIILKKFIHSNFNSHSSFFKELRDEMKKEYQSKLLIERGHIYKDPPNSIKITSTNSFLQNINYSLNADTVTSLLKNDESVIYQIALNESKCKRQDPYTGAQLIYDYLYCRKGIYPENKYRNLILHFPKISLSAWEEKNPNDPNSKSSNWYISANALVFSDGIKLLR